MNGFVKKGVLCIVFIFFILSQFVFDSSIKIEWNTFLGDNQGFKNYISLSDSGHLLFTGTADEEWGTPVRSRSKELQTDSIVVKLDKNGHIQWHTYLGGDYSDESRGITTDKYGNVYVIGVSWGGDGDLL